MSRPCIETGATPSFLWFAAIQSIERIEDPASLVGAGYVNSAHAQQVTATTAETALTAKIKCKDLKKFRWHLD
jgi:hypothetical protein